MRTTPVCSQISCWMPGCTVSTKVRVGAATAVPAAVAINSRATRTRGAYKARYMGNTRMDHRSLQRRCAANTSVYYPGRLGCSHPFAVGRVLPLGGNHGEDQGQGCCEEIREEAAGE